MGHLGLDGPRCGQKSEIFDFWVLALDMCKSVIRFVRRDQVIELMHEFRIDSSGDGFDQVSITRPKYLIVSSPNIALEGKSSLYSCFSRDFMLEYVLRLHFWWFLMVFEANLIKFLHLRQ